VFGGGSRRVAVTGSMKVVLSPVGFAGNYDISGGFMVPAQAVPVPLFTVCLPIWGAPA